MAKATNKSEEVNQPTPEIDFKKENEQLKNDMSELKLLVQQLLQQNALQAQKKEEIISFISPVDEEVQIIPPNKLINITSLFFGGMTLKAAHNKTIRFDRFGVTIPVTFEDLTHICSNQRSFAEEGYFFIHNQEAIKSLYLNENYKKFINAQMIENFITLPSDQIESIYKHVTNTIKETIVDVVLRGIKSDNPKYMDRNKIDLIGRLSDKNLYKIAHEYLD